MRHTGAGLEQLHRQSVPPDSMTSCSGLSFRQLLAGLRRALLSGSAGHVEQVLVTFKQLDGEQARRQAILVRKFGSSHAARSVITVSVSQW